MTSNFKTASKNVLVSWRKLLPANKQSNPSGAERLKADSKQDFERSRPFTPEQLGIIKQIQEACEETYYENQ
jgi:hypothetical protein